MTTLSIRRQRFPLPYSAILFSNERLIPFTVTGAIDPKERNMTHYRHDAITINHRRLSIDDIVAGAVPALDEFEVNTFSFIRRWLSSADTFELHTSGSTGDPKKISFRRDQMTASAQMTAKALSLQPEYTALV